MQQSKFVFDHDLTNAGTVVSRQYKANCAVLHIYAGRFNMFCMPMFVRRGAADDGVSWSKTES